jgi:hypothetical protein
MIYNKLTPVYAQSVINNFEGAVDRWSRLQTTESGLLAVFGPMNIQDLEGLRADLAPLLEEAKQWTRLTEGRRAKVDRVFRDLMIDAPARLVVDVIDGAVRLFSRDSKGYFSPGLDIVGTAPASGIRRLLEVLIDLSAEIQASEQGRQSLEAKAEEQVEEQVEDLEIPAPSLPAVVDPVERALDQYFDHLEGLEELDRTRRELVKDQDDAKAEIERIGKVLEDAFSKLVISSGFSNGSGSSRAVLAGGGSDGINVFEMKTDESTHEAAIEFVRSVAVAKTRDFCDLAQTAVIRGRTEEGFLEFVLPTGGPGAVEDTLAAEVLAEYLEEVAKYLEAVRLHRDVEIQIQDSVDTMEVLRPRAKSVVRPDGAIDVSFQISGKEFGGSEAVVRLDRKFFEVMNEQEKRTIGRVAIKFASQSLADEDFRGRNWKSQVEDIVEILG